MGRFHLLDGRTVENKGKSILINRGSYIKGGIQAKGILKQDPEANI